MRLSAEDRHGASSPDPGHAHLRRRGGRTRVTRSTRCASRSTVRKTARSFCATRTATARSSASRRSSARAVKHRNVLEMIEAGGNVYYLAKLAGIFGLNVQDIGAQQTGMTVEAFKAKLQGGGESEPWQRSSAASAPRMFRRSATRSPRDCSSEPYWKPFFDGFTARTNGWRRVKPDVVVVFYNDHGLNFFLDKMPTFAVGAANEYKHADEGWGLPVAQPYPGRPRPLLAPDRIAGRGRVRRDHVPGDAGRPRLHHSAGAAVARADMPAGPHRSDRDQHRAASAAVAGALLQARPGRSAARSSPTPPDLNVLVLGTGGLSHQLDGKRAGFINKDFDLMCLDKLVNDPRGARALFEPARSSSRRAPRASSC